MQNDNNAGKQNQAYVLLAEILKIENDNAKMLTDLQAGVPLMLREINLSIEKINKLVHAILAFKDSQGEPQASLPLVPEPVKPVKVTVLEIIEKELRENGGGTTKEISERSGIKESSVSPALYRLWTKGLVTQERIRLGNAKGRKSTLSYYKIK